MVPLGGFHGKFRKDSSTQIMPCMVHVLPFIPKSTQKIPKVDQLYYGYLDTIGDFGKNLNTVWICNQNSGH